MQGAQLNLQLGEEIKKKKLLYHTELFAFYLKLKFNWMSRIFIC